MKFNTFGYLVAEGFKSIFKQKKTTTASIVVMFFTLMMFGIFFLIEENVNYVMTQLSTQQGINAYLDDNLKESELEDIKLKIMKIDGVAGAPKFTSKEGALGVIRTMLGDHQELIEGSYNEEHNPFPASYFVTLTDLNKYSEVEDALWNIKGINDVRSNESVITKLSQISQGVRTGSLVFFGIFIVISIAIISYTIKLTVYARRKEISIMKYVGATNAFIRTPFVVEGIIIGIVSAIIAVAVVGIGYNSVMNTILSSTVFNQTPIVLYTFEELFSKVLLVYLALGIGIGTIGSAISMRRYLKV